MGHHEYRESALANIKKGESSSLSEPDVLRCSDAGGMRGFDLGEGKRERRVQTVTDFVLLSFSVSGDFPQVKPLVIPPGSELVGLWVGDWNMLSEFSCLFSSLRLDQRADLVSLFLSSPRWNTPHLNVSPFRRKRWVSSSSAFFHSVFVSNSCSPSSSFSLLFQRRSFSSHRRRDRLSQYVLSSTLFLSSCS